LDKKILIKDIQWFPGHMAQTRRVMRASLKQVDAVVEILDARIPWSSRNPEMKSLINNKPRMFIPNKADLADPAMTDKWIAYYRKQGITAIAADCKSGKGLKNFVSVVKTQVLKEKIEQWERKGMVGNPVRLMVAGIPNCGKSSFINRIAGRKSAKAEDRPGVTRTKQWIRLEGGVELMDLPGVLWPKFDDQMAAVRLAFTGAIKESIVDIEGLAMMFLETLAEVSPKGFERYKFVPEEGMDGKDLLEMTARKRGMMLKGGIPDTERAAYTVMDEYRAGKLGRITLETPPAEAERGAQSEKAVQAAKAAAAVTEKESTAEPEDRKDG
jgi:ribosome biogenesis GTPase A